MRKAVLLPILIVAGVALAGTRASAQEDRRQFKSPGLILETGGRMGACDVLVFTPDGRHLLAAGDDKVVRIWKYAAGQLEPRTEQVLRWPIWREQRGAIYALALSPNDQGRHVAIGGFGAITPSVAVLDRTTGKIERALTEPDRLKMASSVVWTLAYSPSGQRLAWGQGDGNLWTWDLASAQPQDIRHLGKLTPLQDGPNRVRFVHFLSDTQILSVGTDGQVLRWDTTRPGQPTPLFRFERLPAIHRVAIAPGPKPSWLAAVGEGAAEGKSARVVEVCSLDGRLRKVTASLPVGEYPSCLAFDPRGERLAVGTRTVPQDAAFFKITASRVVFFDLSENRPAIQPGPKLTYLPEAVAFPPDGQHLAVAGGVNQEVTLWQLRPNAPAVQVSEIRSPGNCIWGVGLSDDSRFLGFQDHRAEDPPTPSQQGTGPWRVFDLQDRKWASGKKFQPVRPLREPKETGGWSVEPSRDAYVWNVVGPKGERYALPMDRDRDEMPRCYTFLRSEPGMPVRLVVGHYWGLSVFELRPDGAHRVRLLTGHGGPVMAVAVSRDQKLLVSGSRDQTIAAWSLEDWPSQAELGARFVAQGNKLIVRAVDAGSPAWEAGLVEGDEVVLFAFGGNQFLYDPENKISAADRKRRGIQKVGTLAETLAGLRQPQPGLEFFFQVKRGGEARPLSFLTTIRQRPLWRFFPARDGEWVLWRWRDYYYDTSVHGDSFLGWHVNTGDMARTPDFVKAEQLRRRFHQPDKVMAAVKDPPEKVATPDIVLPQVKIETTVKGVVTDADVPVLLTVQPRFQEAGQELRQATLWVNDYRLETWKADKDGFRQRKVEVPQRLLHRGTNLIRLQCYNAAGGRGEAQVSVDFRSLMRRKPNLYGVVVGVNEYRKSRCFSPARGVIRPSDLTGANDARLIAKACSGQRGTELFDHTFIHLLVDEDATRPRILEKMKAVAQTKQLQPDDWLLVFLAGHGDQATEDGKFTSRPNSYFFVPADYDYQRHRETGLSSQALFDALAEVPCRKLVILDTCHAGDSLMNPVRDLTREGIGPLIMAACAPHELATDTGANGLFTLRLLRTIEEPADFRKADLNNDGKLDAYELFTHVKSLFEKLDDDQHPTCYPRDLERIHLIQGKPVGK